MPLKQTPWIDGIKTFRYQTTDIYIINKYSSRLYTETCNLLTTEDKIILNDNCLNYAAKIANKFIVSMIQNAKKDNK